MGGVGSPFSGERSLAWRSGVGRRGLHRSMGHWARRGWPLHSPPYGGGRELVAVSSSTTPSR
eukprot:1042121-Pyramimonas_sp.AAC.1